MIRILMSLFLFLNACATHKLAAGLPQLPAPPALPTATANVQFAELASPKLNPHDCANGIIPFRVNEFLTWLPDNCYRVAPGQFVSVINRTSKALHLRWQGYAALPLVQALMPGPDGMDHRVTTAVLTPQGPGAVAQPCSIVYALQPTINATMVADAFMAPVGVKPDPIAVEGHPFLLLAYKVPGPGGFQPVVSAPVARWIQTNILGQLGGNVIEFIEVGACPEMKVTYL